MGTRRRRVSVIYFISKLVKWDDLRMEIISNPSQVEIKKAAQALKEGQLVAFPTETVYGLGADATNEKAVSRVYSVKGRPTGHPLIVHISSINRLDKWAVNIPEYALKLANEFWPGPMTLILKRSHLAQNFITGGQDNVGIRIPSNLVAHEVIKEFEVLSGSGVVAPSANRFGAVSPTSARDVVDELGDSLNPLDLILDDGPSRIGVESTIINCLGATPTILRPGAITVDMVEQVTALHVINADKKNLVKASGLMDSHYSPKAQIILDQQPKIGDGFLAMSVIPTPVGSIRLASPTTVEEYARGLYSALRLGDKKNLSKIFVILPDEVGLGEAIRDRLLKAAD
jgi:L-threonylcarbamoyladenylate synthase